MREPAMSADPSECLPQRARCSSDQDRPCLGAILRQGVVPQPPEATSRAPPPSRKIKQRMVHLLAAAELLRHFRDQCRSWRFGPRIEGAHIVSTVTTGKQRTPVHCAEHCPKRDCPDV